MIPLVQDLTTRYRVTHVLWHQGEADFALKTDPARYKEYFLSFVESLRANAIDAPVFISKATRCLPGWSEPNAIRTAQQELASIRAGAYGQESTRTSSWTLRTDMTTATSRTREK